MDSERTIMMLILIAKLKIIEYCVYTTETRNGNRLATVPAPFTLFAQNTNFFQTKIAQKKYARACSTPAYTCTSAVEWLEMAAKRLTSTRCCRCTGSAKCLQCACVRSGIACSRCLPGDSGNCHNRPSSAAASPPTALLTGLVWLVLSPPNSLLPMQWLC